MTRLTFRSIGHWLLPASVLVAASLPVRAADPMRPLQGGNTPSPAALPPPGVARDLLSPRAPPGTAPAPTARDELRAVRVDSQGRKQALLGERWLAVGERWQGQTVVAIEGMRVDLAQAAAAQRVRSLYLLPQLQATLEPSEPEALVTRTNKHRARKQP